MTENPDTHICFYKTCVKKTQMTYKCSWNMVVMGSLLLYAPHLVAKQLSISMYKPQNPPPSADPWHLQDDFSATVRQISHWFVVNLHGKLENPHHYRYFSFFPLLTCPFSPFIMDIPAFFSPKTSISDDFPTTELFGAPCAPVHAWDGSCSPGSDQEREISGTMASNLLPAVDE